MSLTAVKQVALTVYGTPAPKGSKRHVGNGVMLESSAKVKPWQLAVVWAAREAKVGRIEGPVSAYIVFTLAKPKSAPRMRVTYPDKYPDIDKCVRSTLDGMVQAGVIEDDARVVSLLTVKTFPNEHDRALDVPGAYILIRSIGGA